MGWLSDDSVDPNHSDANMNMALVAIRFRDYEAAEKSLKVALRDKRLSKDIETYLALGVAQRGLRKYDDAEKAYRQAAKIKGSDPRPLLTAAPAPRAPDCETAPPPDASRRATARDRHS